MGFRTGFVAAWFLAATAAAPSDPRLDAARVAVFQDWVEHGPDEVVPKATVPAFCVGDEGWILVDEAVVLEPVELFAGVEERGPFAASLRARDDATGLALLHVAPETLAGRTCLELSSGTTPPTSPPLAAGTPVLDGTGRWVGVGVAGDSKRRLGTDATGEWVGQDDRRRAIKVAGLEAVERLIAQGRDAIARGAPIPPAEPVTVGSSRVFPRSLRGRAAPPPDALARYEATSDQGLRLELLTPASLETLSRIDDGVYPPRGEFFRWEDHVAMWEPAVAVQVAPEFHWTGGSRASAVAATLFFIPAVLGGGPPPTFRATWTSGKEPIEFRLERAGVAVPPSDARESCFDGPMRIATPGHDHPDPRVVRGCRTVALFDPSAFAPGAEVVLVVTPEGKRPHRVPIPPETLERIASDFAPWRAWLAEDGARARPPRLRASPTWEVLEVALEDGEAFRFFFADGSRLDVTRRLRDGVPVLRVPVWRKRQALRAENMNPAGWLEITPDEFVFTPLEERLAEKTALRIPRAEASVAAGPHGAFRISKEAEGWSFVPRFDGETATGLVVLPRRSQRVPVTAWIVKELGGVPD